MFKLKAGKKAAIGLSAGAAIGVLGLAIAGTKRRRNGHRRADATRDKDKDRVREIQVRETLDLQRKWKKKGDPTCDHPRTSKEFYKDSPTGYRVCTTCGASVK